MEEIGIGQRIDGENAGGEWLMSGRAIYRHRVPRSIRIRVIEKRFLFLRKWTRHENRFFPFKFELGLGSYSKFDSHGSDEFQKHDIL